MDITPPTGIRFHNWSYSPSPISTGAHRTLEAKLIALAAAPGDAPALLVSLDLGWWMDAADEWALRGGILADTGIEPDRLIVALTHTHSGPSITRADGDLPGGELIAPYLDGVRRKVSAAATELLTRLEPCVLDWATGHCTAAVNRDLYRADEGRYVLGANDGRAADSTLVVGRLTAEAQPARTVAVIANYAMHPTTLGGENALASADFVGAARELVEAETGGVFLFLQGASGDLSPREQYTSDTSVADRHGRTLGHAVLSVLSNLAAPGSALRYDRTIESGAPLGAFTSQPNVESGPIAAETVRLELETQQNTPPASPDPHVQADRELRAARVRSNVGAVTTPFPITMWTIGPARIIAYPGEAYSELQQTLRAEFPREVLVFANLANGAHQGYLPPAAAYDDGRYPAWQSPLARGSLERLIAAVRSRLAPAPPLAPPLHSESAEPARATTAHG